MTHFSNTALTAPLRAWGFVLLTPLLGASLGSLSSAVLSTDLAIPAPGWLTSQVLAPAWPVPEHDVSRTAVNT